MANEDDVMVTCSKGDIKAAMQEARAAAVNDFVKGVGAKVREATGYYSTVRFQIHCEEDAGVPGLFHMSIGKGIRQAFAYKLGDSNVTIAGYETPTGLAPKQMTLAETNLSQVKSTRNGESYIITGISSFLSEDSDAEAARLVWAACHVQSVTNDQNFKPLGRLSFFPAQSTLNGEGNGNNHHPAPSQNTYAAKGFRGSEGTNDKFDLSAAPIIWRPAGKTDGSLYLAIELPNDIRWDASARAGALPAIDPWTPAGSRNSAPLGPQPADTPLPVVTSTYVDITFRLDGSSLATMSENQLP